MLTKHFPSLAHALNAGIFSGKFQEVLTLYPSEKALSLVLIGLGLKDKVTIERLRRVAATAAKTARTLKAKSLALAEPEQMTLPSSVGGSCEIAAALAEGAVLSLYKFNKYLTGDNNHPLALKSILILGSDRRRLNEIRRGADFSNALCAATYVARDLGNAPANEIFPDSLARFAKASGRKNKFKVSILDEGKIRRLKMGGLLAVTQGSDAPPRFIIMEHNGARQKRNLPTVVLVGKGITFDAGGISIKPAAGMAEMKMDMCGAAAVIGAMQAIAQLRLPLRVVGLIPSAENLLGGSAMKPGDIIKHLNGKTSEVDNTDAEGRLVLADALSYASRYKPDLVIDLATLTGHVVVSLGTYATGMMGNNDRAMEGLKQAGERTYERVWQLPMFEEYEKLNKSDVADVKNSGGRPAGAITAAFFLKQFIGDYNWVHLDIAGTAILSESLDYTPKGASGVGVRLLVDFLRNWNA